MIKKIYTWGLILLAGLVLGSCKSDKSPLNRSYKRTILMYAMADNNIEKLIGNNVGHMIEGLEKVAEDDLSNCNLLVYFQGTKWINNGMPRLLKIDMVDGKPRQYVIKNYSRISSTNPKRVKEVIDFVFSKYPAESQGMIFSSHADGWLPAGSPRTRWIGQDETFNQFMELIDLKHAMSRFQTKPLDFILFDSCFMQSVEVAYEFRNLTKFSIGSATETPGPGGPYQDLVPVFYAKNNSRDLAHDIANTYFEAYEQGKILENWCKEYGASMGVVESAKLQALKSATVELITNHRASLLKGFNLDGVHYYDRSKNNYYFDMYRVFEANVDLSAFNTWNRSFSEAMMYFNTTESNFSIYINYPYGGLFSMEKAKGLGMYAPNAQRLNNPKMVTDTYKKLEWYNDVMYLLEPLYN